MIIGVITTYNNLNSNDEDDKETTREATQADFDTF